MRTSSLSAAATSSSGPGGMTAPRDALAARIRTALSSNHGVREVRMFGGTAFMLHERMLVHAGRDGTLLVRIDPDRSPELLQHEGARPSYMGADRPMGPGWLTVERDALGNDADLSHWIAIALEFHSSAETASDR